MVEVEEEVIQMDLLNDLEDEDYQQTMTLFSEDNTHSVTFLLN